MQSYATFTSIELSLLVTEFTLKWNENDASASKTKYTILNIFSIHLTKISTG